MRLWVCIFPLCRHSRFFIIVPFEFIAEHIPFSFFNIVNLLPFPCPPKISIGRKPLIRTLLESFYEQEIFPQLAYIITRFQGIPIGNERISNAVIIEEILAFFCNLAPQITTKSAEIINDERFFKKI